LIAPGDVDWRIALLSKTDNIAIDGEGRRRLTSFPMRIRFSNDELDRAEVDLRFRPPFATQMLKAYRKKLNSLRATVDERDLWNNKGLNFEKYHAVPGQYSIRLNDQYRILLEMEGEAPNKTLVIVAITDHYQKKVL
jgi:proteic killer suppression protein